MSNPWMFDHIVLSDAQKIMVRRATNSALWHGINICHGRPNPALGDCVFEAAIFNNNDRSCFTEKFSLPIDQYRKMWISEGENMLFDSDFNPGYTNKEWKAGFSQLKKPGVYEVDFFGDLVIPCIAIGMKRNLLIFNTNPHSLREPVTLIKPAQFGVMPSIDNPIVLAYNMNHYESMHPKSDADDLKCLTLLNLIIEGHYPYSYNDLPRLVDSNEIPADFLVNNDVERTDTYSEKLTKKVMIDSNKIMGKNINIQLDKSNTKKQKERKKEVIKSQKKIKDMDIEERRSYHREKYRERKERLSNKDMKNLQLTWKEKKSSERNKKRDENEDLLKATWANEKRLIRSKKRTDDPEGFEKQMANEKRKERSKKRLENSESFKCEIANEKRKVRSKKDLRILKALRVKLLMKKGK